MKINVTYVSEEYRGIKFLHKILFLPYNFFIDWAD